MMKVIKLGFCTLILSLMLTSCGEEGLLGGLLGDDEHGEEGFFALASEVDSFDLSCGEFIYPITITLTDGTTSTINNETELEQAISTAASTGDFPTINFPIQVMGEDDLPVSVVDEEALCEIFEECFEDDFDDDDCHCDEEEECFEINYPITLVLPDGSNVTVNDDEALENAIDNYYDTHPNDTGDVTLVYPITITMLEDASTVVINNDDDLDEVFEECFGDDDFEECFDLQFPISLAMPDGSTVVTNSYEELDSLYEAWEQANPNATNEPELIFPITVILEDGSTEVINDEDELDELFEDCYEDECEMVRGTDIILGASNAVVGRMTLKKGKIAAKKAGKVSKN